MVQAGENCHTSGKPCHIDTFSFTSSTCTGMGLNLSSCSDRPPTDHLSQIPGQFLPVIQDRSLRHLLHTVLVWPSYFTLCLAQSARHVEWKESSSDASMTSDCENITIIALWTVTPCGWVGRYHPVREDVLPVNVVRVKDTFRTRIDPDRPQHKDRYSALFYYQIFLIVTYKQLNFTSCHLRGLGLKKYACLSAQE
jgi:hypothetical protein